MNELQQRFFEHLAGIQELEIFYKNYWSVYWKDVIRRVQKEEVWEVSEILEIIEKMKSVYIDF